MRRQRRRSRTVTLSPADLASCQGSRWARAPCAATKTQLTRGEVTKNVSAVLEKLPTHYYVPVQIEECCRGYTSKLTDLQPKNLAARSEQERGFKVQLQRPSCTCIYTITICSFIKKQIIVVIIVYRTFCRR